MSSRDEPQALKRALRARVREELSRLTPARRALASEGVCRRLWGLDLVRHARAILFYHAMPGEIDLSRLARRALGAGIPIALPRAHWPTRSLSARRVSGVWRGLVAGRHAILEPSSGAPELALGDGCVVLVPGLAFDRGGGRLGRGAGFYDRFLSGLPQGVTRVGVAHDRQVIPEVPTMEWDARVRWVATPGALISCGRS